MNPLEPKSALRTITSTLALALLVAIATYIILLIVGAGRLSHAAVPATVHGPFNLFELQKEAATGGGYQASIALLPASGYYAAHAFAGKWRSHVHSQLAAKDPAHVLPFDMYRENHYLWPPSHHAHAWLRLGLARLAHAALWEDHYRPAPGLQLVLSIAEPIGQRWVFACRKCPKSQHRPASQPKIKQHCVRKEPDRPQSPQHLPPHERQNNKRIDIGLMVRHNYILLAIEKILRVQVGHPITHVAQRPPAPRQIKKPVHAVNQRIVPRRIQPLPWNPSCSSVYQFFA
jgi:hypothetical protein